MTQPARLVTVIESTGVDMYIYKVEELRCVKVLLDRDVVAKGRYGRMGWRLAAHEPHTRMGKSLPRFHISR